VSLLSPFAPEEGFPALHYQRLSGRGPLPGTRLVTNVWEVRCALRDLQPDILHAHYINECGWLGALSGFHPFVLTAWGSDVYVAPQRSQLARILTPWSVRRADYVTADSQDQIKRLRAMGARQADMVTMGVDLDEFAGQGGALWRRTHGIHEHQVVILSPRVWIPNSNIETIVEAFARVHAERPRTLLVLKRMKEAEQRIIDEVHKRLAALGLADFVRIIEEVPSRDLPPMYAAADVTVSNCSSDGTPVSMLEAMASGSAVVASRLPSLMEWVQEGATGLLAVPGDVDALAAQLLVLVDDPALRRRMGQNGRRLVAEQADRRKNLDRVEERYCQLAVGRARDEGRGRENLNANPDAEDHPS
jgi:glycosyltransferase involved in cell wall biosynthesis